MVVAHRGADGAWLKRAWIDEFGADHIWEVYGATEGLARTWIGGREWLERPGSVGRPLGGARLRILGPDGEDLPPARGEIFAMPPGGPGSSYRYIGAERRATRRWLGIGRRHRPARRRRLSLSRRPPRRSHHLRRRQYLAGRGRGGDSAPSRGPLLRGGRSAPTRISASASTPSSRATIRRSTSTTLRAFLARISAATSTRARSNPDAARCATTRARCAKPLVVKETDHDSSAALRIPHRVPRQRARASRVRRAGPYDERLFRSRDRRDRPHSRAGWRRRTCAAR